MKKIVAALNRNPVFRFVSSVRLAVPLMLVLAAIVACGTIIESRYNTEVAGLWVYKTSWFYSVMGLLWLNIFAAALSRYPYKKHHTGFLVTHLGMLTLLAGAFITASAGIDGQLRVPEGNSSATVFLPELSVDVRNKEGALVKSTPFTRRLSAGDAREVNLASALAGTGYRIERYEPFVDPGATQDSAAAPMAAAHGSGKDIPGGLKFKLQSQFFDVVESVGPTRREMSMGPVRIRYVMGGATKKTSAKAKAPKAQSSPSGKGPTLVIKSFDGGSILATLALPQQKSFSLADGTKVSVVGIFEQASVVANKLQEGGQKGANPALEIKIEKGGKFLRDVAFAKFKEFSLHPTGSFGLKFEYNVSGTASSAEPAQELVETDLSETQTSSDRSGNVIEFVVDKAAKVVDLHLYKNNQVVLTKRAIPNTPVETPWMGMKITLLDTSVESSGSAGSTDTSTAAMSAGSSEAKDSIKIVELETRSPLPPCAIHVVPLSPGQGGGFWLVEGSGMRVQTSEGSFDISFGPSSIELPFVVNLKKFVKVDYPGTETPKSFESHVTVNSREREVSSSEIVISMNEPLKRDGYILYQSAYELAPGQPPVTVLSVNHDPGRPVKYAGSLILVLGIAIFTLMRSRFYKNWEKKRSIKPSVAQAENKPVGH